MEFVAKCIGYFIGAVGVLALLIIMQAVPVYYFWNWLMPQLFNLPLITFWQALGLLILSSALFKTTNHAAKGKAE